MCERHFRIIAPLFRALLEFRLFLGYPLPATRTRESMHCRTMILGTRPAGDWGGSSHGELFIG
jgi:hypothetical protein